MAAVTSRQIRWRSAVLVVIGICVAAVILRISFFPVKPADIGPEAEVTSTAIPPQSTTEADSPSNEATPASAHALDELLQAAYKARDALQDVQDYSAVFDKREQVGRKFVTTKMNLKVRV
ncbi:MAG TPA: hypothetical protein VGM98_24450, partial [Schlesneria sp.]